ncbi:MAG: S41 family peptidase [Saprospiraceae bacterium]
MKNNVKGLLIITMFAIPFFSNAQKEPGEEIVSQVIQSIDNQYYDTTYNGKDWKKIELETVLLMEMLSLKNTQFVDSLLFRLDDPSVRVLTPEQFKILNTELTKSQHIGIGLTEMLCVDIDSKTREVKIITPLHNSPAAKANLQPNDIILSINRTSVDGLQLEEVMDLMRLKEGKKVKLKIKRNGNLKKIKVKTALVQQSLEPYFKVVEHDGKQIGCIWFPQFTNAAAPQFQDIIQQFQEKNVDGILLDLRNNPGGLLQEAQRIGGFCMGQAAMGKTEGKSNYLSVLPTLEKKITDLPIVVLTNNGTASAAELLAGSLQYEKRAMIIGERTNGKGLIHTFIPLANDYVMACSIARISLLNGRDLLTEGVEPDIIIKNDKPFSFGQIENDQQFLKGLEQF